LVFLFVNRIAVWSGDGDLHPECAKALGDLYGATLCFGFENLCAWPISKLGDAQSRTGATEAFWRYIRSSSPGSPATAGISLFLAFRGALAGRLGPLP
jgi:hypothetical protein